MITVNDLIRATNALKAKIFMSLARAIVKAIKNDEGTQKIQLTVLADETLADVERLQEYGLETYPDTDAEAFAAFIGGNREVGAILVVHDRRYRPKTLNSGEVMLYTKFGQTVHLKDDGSIELKDSDGGIILLANDKATLKVSNIELGDGTIRRLIDERIAAKYDAHTHNVVGVQAGAATIVSAVPSNAPLVLDDIATTVTKAE